MGMWFSCMKHSTYTSYHPKVSLGTLGVLYISVLISMFQILVGLSLVCLVFLCFPRNQKIQHIAFPYNFLLPVTSLGVSLSVPPQGVATLLLNTVKDKLAFQWWPSTDQLAIFTVQISY